MALLDITEFSQLALDAKGIPVQRPAHPPITIQDPIPISMTSTQGARFNSDATFIRLQADQPLHYVIGPDPTATTSDTPLLAGQVEYVGIKSDHKVAVIAANLGGLAPVNTKAPIITGEVSVGSVLNCATGVWYASPPATLSHQWMRDGTPIPLATSLMYQITAADRGHELGIVETATNSLGSVDMHSNVLAIP